MQLSSLSKDLVRFSWERGHLGRFRSGRDALAPRVGMADNRKLNGPAEVGEFVEVLVYNRYGLRPGDRFAGPAVIEERDSED